MCYNLQLATFTIRCRFREKNKNSHSLIIKTRPSWLILPLDKTDDWCGNSFILEMFISSANLATDIVWLYVIRSTADVDGESAFLDGFYRKSKR